ncbi:MAG: EAL domain-containing protein [Janthinobacterium lividum]
MDRGPPGGQGAALNADVHRTPAPSTKAASDALVPAGERLSRLAALALGFDHGTVLLPDERTRPLLLDRPSAAADLDRDVLASGTALVVERAEAEQGPLGSYVGVPVSCEGQVVSVLSVSDELPRTISRRDVAVLLELAELWSVELCRAQDAATVVDPVAIDLARGLERGEVVPWYQPVVDLVTGEVVGVEALARWRRAPGVVEPPSVFIPVAEQSDLILEVDLAVLRRAFVDLATWQQTRPGFWVTTNLSARHLGRDGWLDQLRDAAATAGVEPTTVILELTETAAPADEGAGRVVVDAMREMGFHVWFDDFGSGWSALSDLSRFTVDGIKIDRSYADQLGTKTGEVVIAALVSAAAELGLSVTIEGIETPSQYERARNLGCHFGQGYLWSRPVPPAAVTRFL